MLPSRRITEKANCPASFLSHTSMWAPLSSSPCRVTVESHCASTALSNLTVPRAGWKPIPRQASNSAIGAAEAQACGEQATGKRVGPIPKMMHADARHPMLPARLQGSIGLPHVVGS